MTQRCGLWANLRVHDDPISPHRMARLRLAGFRPRQTPRAVWRTDPGASRPLRALEAVRRPARLDPGRRHVRAHGPNPRQVALRARHAHPVAVAVPVGRLGFDLRAGDDQIQARRPLPRAGRQLGVLGGQPQARRQVPQPVRLHRRREPRRAPSGRRRHPLRRHPAGRGLDAHQHGAKRPGRHPLGGGGRHEIRASGGEARQHLPRHRPRPAHLGLGPQGGKVEVGRPAPRPHRRRRLAGGPRRVRGHEHLQRHSPERLETMWSLALPDAAIEAGELCLRAEAGHDLSTGSMVRVTRNA